MDAKAKPGKIKIATFNLMNLACPNIDYYEGQHYTAEMYEKKCAWTARQLDLMGADLVMFQEVFHKEALAHALSLCAPETGARSMRIFAPEQGELTPQVCMASRYEIRSCEWIADIPQEVSASFNKDGKPLSIDGAPIVKFSHRVLRARVLLPDLGAGVEAVIFGAHLKSKSPDALEGGVGGDLNNPIGQARSLVRRAVEAVGLRALVLRELIPRQGAATTEGPPVIVCGDCNDDTIAVTTQILCGERFGGYAKLLRSALDLHSSRSLYSAYYTYIYDGHYESLDHILLSDHFAPGNDRRLGDVEYVRFFTDHLVDDTLYKGSIPKYATDHGTAMVILKPRSKAGVPGA